MTDVHKPKLSELDLTEDEQDAVEYALTFDNPWKHDSPELRCVSGELKSVKEKLLNLHRLRQDETCCYCRTILKGSGPFGRDREHILPKSKFKSLTYEAANLSVSCKRCNMSKKKDRTDFVDNEYDILNDYMNKSRYYIIHPNFECWDDYITRIVKQKGADYIVYFEFDQDNPKAKFTYDFFELNELQTDSFDKFQGLKIGSRWIEGLEDEELPDRV